MSNAVASVMAAGLLTKNSARGWPGRRERSPRSNAATLMPSARSASAPLSSSALSTTPTIGWPERLALWTNVTPSRQPARAATAADAVES